MSLFVTLEFIKGVQAKIMEYDLEMVYDEKKAIAKTSNLNEELARVF